MKLTEKKVFKVVLDMAEREQLTKTVIFLDNLVDTMNSEDCSTIICDITGTDVADYGVGEITFVKDIINDLLRINEIN